jgi:hypothetical protein
MRCAQSWRIPLFMLALLLLVASSAAGGPCDDTFDVYRGPIGNWHVRDSHNDETCGFSKVLIPSSYGCSCCTFTFTNIDVVYVQITNENTPPWHAKRDTLNLAPDSTGVIQLCCPEDGSGPWTFSVHSPGASPWGYDAAPCTWYLLCEPVPALSRGGVLLLTVMLVGTAVFLVGRRGRALGCSV